MEIPRLCFRSTAIAKDIMIMYSIQMIRTDRCYVAMNNQRMYSAL